MLFLFAAAAPAQLPQIRLIKVASGFASPVFVGSAGDRSNRLFVVEQQGRIRILRNGVIAATPFLDIRSRVLCCGEQGLLSVAFPPDFSTSGQFYVYYTDKSSFLVIARYHAGASPDAADPSSETVIMRIDHVFASNHNGGQLQFGPDGFLYVGTGDGGGGGDPLGNGQNKNALLGKLLRIDVSAPAYAIPSSNPFVGQSGVRPEIWAYGLRNPFRFSFDRTTGDLYIGDVGQNLFEEVDFAPAGGRGGENYGWNTMEGFQCYNQPACNQTGLTLPVAAYDHTGDCSVTGGYVYRGARYPSMQGVYFYGDYCSGRIRGLTRIGSAWQNRVLLAAGFNISTFGQDDAGEIYVAAYGSGDIYTIAGGPPSFLSIGVVNAASFQPGLVPGSIAALFGAGLNVAAGAFPSGSPLATSLLGSSVKVNGVAAPLFAVANVTNLDQINFQVPYGIPAGGTAQVVVTNNGVDSAPVSVDVFPAQPGVFMSGDGVHAAGSSVVQGGVAVLWTTGLGPVSNWPGDGTLAPLAPLARTVADPAVTIAGIDATVEYSGLAPLFAGLYQINVRVPAGVPAGDQDVVVSAAGQASKPVKLTITAAP